MATAEEKHNVRLSKALSWLLRHHLDLVSEITKQPIGKGVSSVHLDIHLTYGSYPRLT